MATQAVATRDENPIIGFRNQLEKRANEFKLALPGHITPEKFQRTVLTAVQSDPDLLGADRQSLLLACMKAAQDGLLPDKREAALVIFTENKKVGAQWVKRKLVQYMPMVYGLRKKILQSGEVTDIFAQVVYRQEWEEGTFYYEEGTDRQLRHKPNLALADLSDDDIIAAYSIATFKDGSKSFEVMRRAEINKVRSVSQTGAEGKTVKFGNDAGKPVAPKGPWVDWFSEMAKKTVMRRHSKTLPMSGDLIDVEADEINAAESTARVLAIEPDQPQTTAIPGQHQGGAPALEHSREVDEQLDRDAFRQFDGHPEHDEDGVILEDEEKPKAPAQRRARSPQPTEAATPPAAAAGPSTSAERVAADQPTNGNDGRGEAVTLASALDEVNTAETVIDVNSRTSALIPLLNDDDAAALRERALERIAELKGGK